MAVAITPDIYAALESNALNVAAPGVLSNDTSTTASAIVVSKYTQPANGTLTLKPDGSFSYVPTTGYTGPDQFTYTATDARGATGTAAVQLNVNATTQEASVFAGTRLASINSMQGTLLNTVLGGLVGTNLNLTAADYTGLAGASLNGGQLANALAAELNVTPGQALTTNATLTQVFTAAASVASADGNIAEASALNRLASSVGAITGPVQLGNLIQANPNDGSLAGASINALDLVNGTAQLFNLPERRLDSDADHRLGRRAGPSGSGLLGDDLRAGGRTADPDDRTHRDAVSLVGHPDPDRPEPQRKSRHDRADRRAHRSTSKRCSGPLATTTATASLGSLSVFTDVAEGQGTISAINALATAVTLQATPGLADVYLGDISDSLFFDRNHVINPATDVTYGNVGTLNIGATVLGVPALNQSTGIQLRSVGTAAAPTAATEVFDAPFPQSQTVSTNAAFLTNLANSLVTNLGVKFSGSLGTVLDPLVNTVILPAVTPVVTNVVTPLLTPVLSDVVDPALQQLGTRLGQLDLTVNAVNAVAAPAANADFATTLENQAVAVPVLANDATIPGEAVTVTAVTQPTHGTAVINPDGTITYTPTAGYFGPDTFTYTITDPNGLTSTAAVTANVQPLAPVAVPDTYNGQQGAPLTVAGPGVLGNDTDPDGLPLTAVIATGPTRGSVTLNPDGSFTYTPTTGDYGPDTFTYQASNGTTLSTPVTVTVNVQPILPTTNPDTLTATAGQTLTLPVASGVLGNDIDPNGLPLSAVLTAGPSHGTLTLNTDGSLTYTPTAGFVGTDNFSYHATDSNGPGNTAAVTINVQPGAPVANPDIYAVVAGTSLTVPGATGVLTNDTDPNGLPLSAVAVAQPTHGTLTLNADGSLTYTPAAGFVGTDGFTYRATDSTGPGNMATVAISVGNGTLLASPDAYTTTAGTTLTVPVATGVLTNDSGPNGMPLTAVIATGPSHGTLTLNPRRFVLLRPGGGLRRRRLIHLPRC